MRIENKETIVNELQNIYPAQTEIIVADSILIRDKSVLTKIPVKRTYEEAFIIRELGKMGINTPQILLESVLHTQNYSLPYYNMEYIPNIQSVIREGNKMLTPDYYSFLAKVMNSCRKYSIKGFGGVTLDNNQLYGECDSEKDFFTKLIDIVEKRKYWPAKDIDEVKLKIKRFEDSSTGVLVHNDLLNNIFYSPRDNSFLLIDPQTSISSANIYWDISSYLIYANGYNCVKGLVSFLRLQNIPNWEKFLLTAKTIALERISFYHIYDQSRLEGMIHFFNGLENEKIMVGQEFLIKSDFNVEARK